MNVKRCDRCSEIIGETPPFCQAKLPTYCIYKMDSFMIRRTVDLCPGCMGQLENWLTELNTHKE